MADVNAGMDDVAEDPCAMSNDHSMTGLRIGAIFIILVSLLLRRYEQVTDCRSLPSSAPCFPSCCEDQALSRDQCLSESPSSSYRSFRFSRVPH